MWETSAAGIGLGIGESPVAVAASITTLIATVATAPQPAAVASRFASGLVPDGAPVVSRAVVILANLPLSSWTPVSSRAVISRRR
ncbi:hypothetical protein GCM10022402_10280 [Salinactinospora qingdaonensis]|uniref:Uncharacterized protein n=1 Tax=Salinactinospora qingdaonensis TaxID=702744 RepID=A0ABP7FAA3_9ACTN